MVDFERWYKSIPIITRIYLTLACLTSGAVSFEFVTPLNLYLNFRLVFQKYEIWRLLTTFLYFDRFSINLFFHMHFLYSYCRRLEEHHYHRRTADFFFMLVFGAVSLWLISAFVYDVTFLSHSLVVMVVYVWSRRNPEEHLNVLGMFIIAAPFLPYILLAFSFLFAGVPAAIVDLLGIVVGHVFWYLEDVVPLITGVRVMRTPGFLAGLFPEHEVVAAW
eukprot:TRINITY_DN3915_c0_g1_i1.p1 TRINITY_DN3915_c0_g1~~TRINITY_DN3915_c0_g1_i1.p1  ORF type:complete len:219 (-),score=55.50 TRINITY_DN3915_c0_g1_i1:327-983(-)